MANTSLTALYYYETGKQMPSAEVLSRFANILNVSVDYLVGNTDEPTPFRSDLENISLPVRKIPVYNLQYNTDSEIFKTNINVLSEYSLARLDINFGVKIESRNMEPVVMKDWTLMVKSQPGAQNGEMVVCTYNGKTFVEWFRCENGQIMFISENPEYPPIIVKKNDKFVIHGIVVDVLTGKPVKNFKPLSSDG